MIRSNGDSATSCRQVRRRGSSLSTSVKSARTALPACGALSTLVQACGDASSTRSTPGHQAGSR